MKAKTCCHVYARQVLLMLLALVLTASICVGGVAVAAPVESGEAESGPAAQAAQAAAVAPLSQEPKSIAGEVRSGGLVFRVLEGGESVALVGWHGDKLEGDVVVPSRVASGSDSYAVTAIEAPGKSEDAPEGSEAEGVFTGSAIESVSLPATVETVDDEAFSGCASLARILVSPDNEAFASSDGMLFSKDLSSLLLVPEG